MKPSEHWAYRHKQNHININHQLSGHIGRFSILEGGATLKEIQLNPQRLEAISHRDGPMAVLPVVGSGKTMVLTERMIHLIEEYGINPSVTSSVN